MNWWHKAKSVITDEICVGDSIINKDDRLKGYFINWPLKVTRIEYKKPKYAGGAFVYVDIEGKEQGFYINAVRKFGEKKDDL